jgi:putative tryptophan/tyrosine transport system substrate-binding protein
MRRREFISLLGGAAASSVSWPLAARAQQPGRTPLIGTLMNTAAGEAISRAHDAAFEEALRKLGWTEGSNLRIERRWRDGQAEQALTYAAELVRLAPNAILCSSTTNLIALMKVTQTIPVVFVQVSDPVAQGFVSNLSHPGGNITGFGSYEFSIGGKWLDLLKQIAPGLTRVALVFNPDTSPQSKLFLRSLEAAAPSFGVEVMAVSVRDAVEMEHAIADISARPNGGLVFPTDSFTTGRAERIVGLAAHHRLPAIYARPEFVMAGGLMRYGIDYIDQYRQSASYIDRILKGARPGDLPVQQPTKFTLTINHKTAKALGLDVPLHLLQLADEVIE